MKLIGKLDRAFAKVEEVVLAILLVSMVVLAALQVLLRNIWNTAIDWADVSLNNITLIVGLLGAAIATSEGRHLSIDLFSRAFQGRKRHGLRVVIGVFGVVICGYLALGGWQNYKANYAPWLTNVPKGWSVSRMLGQELADGRLPLWLSQLPLAFGFLLIGFHFALRAIRDVGALITGKAWETAEDRGPEGDEVLDEMQARAAQELAEQEGKAEARADAEDGDDGKDDGDAKSDDDAKSGDDAKDDDDDEPAAKAKSDDEPEGDKPEGKGGDA